MKANKKKWKVIEMKCWFIHLKKVSLIDRARKTHKLTLKYKINSHKAIKTL